MPFSDRRTNTRRWLSCGQAPECRLIAISTHADSSVPRSGERVKHDLHCFTKSPSQWREPNGSQYVPCS